MTGKIKQVVAEVIGSGKLAEEGRQEQASADLRDKPDGVYDAVNEESLPGGSQPAPREPNLPEGLRRERKGPYDKKSRRNEDPTK